MERRKRKVARREVKGQEEDEQCGAGQISQPTKFHKL